MGEYKIRKRKRSIEKFYPLKVAEKRFVRNNSCSSPIQLVGRVKSIAGH